MDESTGLENRSTGNCTVGSNPTLSATTPSRNVPLIPIKHHGGTQWCGNIWGMTKLTALLTKTISKPGRYGSLCLNVAPSDTKPWVQ